MPLRSPRNEFRTHLYVANPFLYKAGIHRSTIIRRTPRQIVFRYNGQLFNFDKEDRFLAYTLFIRCVLIDGGTTQGARYYRSLTMENVLRLAHDRGVLRTSPGYNFRVAALEPAYPTSEFAGFMTDSFPDVDFSKFMWSGNSTLPYGKFDALLNPPAESAFDDITVDQWLNLAFGMMIEYPVDADGNVIRYKGPDLDYEKILGLPLKDSSPGYRDSHIDPGNTTSSKRSETGYYLVQLRLALEHGILPEHHVKASPKTEVIKAGKATRQIFVGNTSSMMTSLLSGQGHIVWSSKPINQGVGLPMHGGSYDIGTARLRRHAQPDTPLKSIDFTSWEYFVHIVWKAAFVFGYLSVCDFDPHLVPMVIAEMASLLCPVIGLSGDQAILVWWLWISGILATLFGNTKLHQGLVNWFISEVAHIFPEEECLKFLSYIIQGDDHITADNQLMPDYVQWLKKLGMQPKIEEDGVFLQRKFNDNTKRWEMNRERCLNKIFHRPSDSLHNKLAQVHSIRLMCHNPQIVEDCDKIIDWLVERGASLSEVKEADRGDFAIFEQGGNYNTLQTWDELDEFHSLQNPEEPNRMLAFLDLHCASMDFMRKIVDPEKGKQKTLEKLLA